MKRVIISGMMICYASFLSGMELGNNGVLTYDCNGTKVTLFKEELYRRPESKATTVTVVGAYEQISLREPCLCDPGAIGDAGRVLPAVVCVKNDKFKYGEEIQWPKTLVLVVEPKVVKLLNRWRYHPTRRIGEDEYQDPVFMDERALFEAGNDLAVCYSSVLTLSYRFFTEKNQLKNIAFPFLSTFSKMPHQNAAAAAVESIFFFIKDIANKDKYEEIQFVVETDEDFNIYKILLEKYFKQVANDTKK